MTVCVVGLGYVGMTLALKLAELGEKVIGVDNNPRIIQGLLDGELHISEPGLRELVRKHLGSNFIPSLGNPDRAETHILCVNTPVDERGEPNLSSLVKAATATGRIVSNGDLVVVRSTVPPGTTRSCVIPALESASSLRVGENLRLCVAPERTVEGKALSELEHLPQIVGGFDAESSEAGQAFFSRITPKVKTVSSMEAAEMAKLIDNCFRYASFAIGNELGTACEALGLDAWEVIEAANWEYPRNDVKLPGAGVGGGCLPKDTRILINSMKKSGSKPRLLEACRDVNDGMPKHIFEIVDEFHRENGIGRSDAKILILGFAFKGKPQVNDTRHSPGGFLSKLLVEKGYGVYGCDPAINGTSIQSFGAKACSVEEGFSGATAVILMNNNPAFAELDLGALSQSMSRPSLLFDGWRILDENRISGAQIRYKRLGNGVNEA